MQNILTNIEDLLCEHLKVKTMKVTIKWKDIKSWIKYNTWIEVISDDIEFEVVESEDTEYFINKYNNESRQSKEHKSS